MIALWFVAGMFIGANVGLVVFALLNAAHHQEG